MIDHLSYSSVNLYLTCARAWRFRYIDKIKTPVAAVLPFGSAFHDAIETYLSIKHEKAPAPVSDIFSDSWQRRLEIEQNIDFGDETPESLAELGQHMLGSEVDVTGGGPNRKARNASTFLNDIVPMMEGATPVIEKRISLQVPGVDVPIIGYIDLITQDGVPCDFKTSAKSWYADKAHDELQVDFYLAALLQAGCAPADLKFRYYVFVKTKKPKIQIIETKRNVGQLFWMMDMVGEVWRGIEAGVFPPTGPGSWRCTPKYCDAWNLCRGK